MFSSCVFIVLMLLLFLSGGAAIYLGVFKGHRADTLFQVKVIGGVLSYGLSAVFWFFCYSHHYLGW